MSVIVFSDRTIINQVLSDPSAPLIVQQLTEALAQEQKAREAFYNSMDTEELKTEFINGEVVVHSPVKKLHNDVSSNVFRILDAFVTENDLGFVGYEKVMIRLTRNDYEPDVCFFSQEKTVNLKDDTSLFPAPDLIIEVLSAKTEARDRGIKFEDYEKHQVMEYWIIDPLQNIIEQYVLDYSSSKYILNKKSDSGTLRSSAIENLRVDIAVFFDKKLTQQMVKQVLTGHQ